MSEVLRRLQLGLNLPTWEDRHGRVARWDDLRAVARSVEAAGIDAVCVPAHLQVRREVGFWECWTVLAALARVSGRVTIGPHVACTGYRTPALLAKMATTLDERCGGRL